MSETRIRIHFDWILNLPDRGPFSLVNDYIIHARRALVDALEQYSPELQTTSLTEYSNSLYHLDLSWEINLAKGAGALHQPQDHVDYLLHNLKTSIAFFVDSLKVTMIEDITLLATDPNDPIHPIWTSEEWHLPAIQVNPS